MLLCSCAFAQEQLPRATPSADAQELRAIAEELRALRATQPAVDPNWAIVLLTVALALVAYRQWQTSVNTLEASKVVERAYVDISHAHGLRINPVATNGLHEVALKIAVKNYGRTPADVTSVVLAMMVAKTLPDEPPYRMGPSQGSSFVMPGERFLITPTIPPIESDVLARVNNGEATLWILGCVEYTDKFGARHRGGYARRYVPNLPPEANNLVFATKHGYNYDRDL